MSLRRAITLQLLELAPTAAPTHAPWHELHRPCPMAMVSGFLSCKLPGLTPRAGVCVARLQPRPLPGRGQRHRLRGLREHELRRRRGRQGLHRLPGRQHGGRQPFDRVQGLRAGARAPPGLKVRLHQLVQNNPGGMLSFECPGVGAQGMYDHDGSSATGCRNCSAGRYGEGGGGAVGPGACRRCPAGRAGPGAGRTNCR